MRIERLSEEYDIDLKYTLFPLHPDTPEDGMLLEEMFRGRNFDLNAAHQRLKNLAITEGLEMTERSRTYNSRKAQELGKWAENQPIGKKIHNHFYKAYFVKDINLAKIENLVDIVESLGLDGAVARSVLENGEYSKDVDNDWQRCRKLGVSAVPTYLCAGKYLTGAQSYQALEELVISAGASRRS